MPYRELYGSPDHRSRLERDEALWRLLRDHPRYAYYGTVVSLSDPRGDAADILACLARLQGLGMCFYTPKADVAALRAELGSRGFETAQSLFCRGGRAAYAASTSYLKGRPAPSGVTVAKLDAASSMTLVAATVDLCESCGLSSMPGEVMRGGVLPGINLVATDPSGAPVVTAASYAMHAPGSPRATEAFWGVLATRQDHRGQGLATWLGALAIRHMWETEGMRDFNTGIKAENAASLATCAKLGVTRTDWMTVFCDGRRRAIDGKPGHIGRSPKPVTTPRNDVTDA